MRHRCVRGYSELLALIYLSGKEGTLLRAVTNLRAFSLFQPVLKFRAGLAPSRLIESLRRLQIVVIIGQLDSSCSYIISTLIITLTSS